MEISMFTDGGSRGNPGPAAIGVVIKEGSKAVKEFGKYIGESTNNDAEYQALIEGLSILNKMGVKSAECFLDSELVVKQLNGLYKVKNENIKKHWKKVKELEKNFSQIKFTHVLREKNKQADKIVNEVLDLAFKK